MGYSDLFERNIKFRKPFEGEIITLCGSTKFMEEYIAEQKRLSLDGNIVISVGLFGHDLANRCRYCGEPQDTIRHTSRASNWPSYHPFEPEFDMTSDAKVMLDELHKRKIDLADRIHVINVDGYIGRSTLGEIAYAVQLRKAITYLEPDVRPGISIDHGDGKVTIYPTRPVDGEDGPIAFELGAQVATS